MNEKDIVEEPDETPSKKLRIRTLKNQGNMNLFFLPNSPVFVFRSSSFIESEFRI